MQEMVKYEGVGPLLYWHFKDACWPEAMPQAVQAYLTQLYYNTVAHNTLLYKELARILEAFGEAGIPVIVLKGAALAATLYEDIGLRPMGDLDLLVEADDLQRAKSILHNFDYVVIKAEHLGMAPWLDEALNHHVHMRGGPQARVAVELHWGLLAGNADWRAPSLDWFWKQAQPLEFKQAAITIEKHENLFQLDLAAHLLYVAAHLMLQHGGNRARLLWFYDLHLLATKYHQYVDWNAILKQAVLLRWVAALYTALVECQERYDTRFPDGYLAELKTLGDVRDWQLVAFMKSPSDNRMVETFRHLPKMRRAVRLRLILTLIFPSPAYMRYRYKPSPEWLWPLYYLYRWVDVLSDGSKMVWEQLRQRLVYWNGH